jgi:predicted GNAT family acetyltransferase
MCGWLGDVADIDVRNAPEGHRYEAVVDGEVAGFAEYQLTDELIVFTHTEVDDAYEGKGVGSALVRGALDDVRALANRKVLPLCPFVKAYISRHREYTDLVYGARPSRVHD